MDTIVNSKNPLSKHTNAELPDLMDGTIVSCLAKNPKTGTNERYEGIFRYYDKFNDAKISIPAIGKDVWRRNFKDCEIVDGKSSADLVGENISTPYTAITISTLPEIKFDINKRFGFLASLVKMVIKGQAVSAIISGSGGLGKSYTVLQQLEIAGFEENIDYVIIKGFSTAKGLYNTLYHNSDKLVVFDDCDSVLQNDVAMNILKGALDSYDKRIITWNSQAIVGSEVPNQFEFEGRIIFISNLPQQKIPQALVSRSATVDVTMTLEEKLLRIETVLPYLEQQVSMEIKEECLEVVKEFSLYAKDLNFRTLLKVIAIRVAAEESENTQDLEDWKDLATYMIVN